MAYLKQLMKQFTLRQGQKYFFAMYSHKHATSLPLYRFDSDGKSFTYESEIIVSKDGTMYYTAIFDNLWSAFNNYLWSDSKLVGIIREGNLGSKKRVSY